MRNYDDEEKGLDAYFSEIDKQEVVVPQQLEERVLKTIEDLPELKHHKGNLIKSIAAAVILFALFTSAVKWVPNFAVYASNIPIVKIAVEWLQGDSGTEFAKQQGYYIIDGITVEEDGIMLSFDNITFDEDRLTMSVVAEGQVIEELLSNRNYSGKESISIIVTYKDFKNPGGLGFRYYDGSSDTKVPMRLEKPFDYGVVQEFLQGSPQYLTLGAEIYLHSPEEKSQLIRNMENIRLPFDYTKIQPSKVYEVNNSYPIERGIMNISTLIISPTRMRLDVSFNMDEGYSFTDIEKGYFADKDGNVYASENVVSSHPTENSRRLYFVPSIYFNNDHEFLYFHYEGIRIIDDKDSKFTISLEETYPKAITFMGKELIIESVKYDSEKSSLKIAILTPENVKINDLKIDDKYSGSWGMSNSPNSASVMTYEFENIEYQAEYEIEMWSAGYLFEGYEKYKIPLK